MRVIFDITLLIIVLSPPPYHWDLRQPGSFILQLFVKVNKCTLVEFWLAAGGWFSRNPKTILLNPTSPPEKIFWPPTIIIFWKLLVRAFIKHLTSRGPWVHCSGPETPTQWKAVSGSDGRRDLSISKGCVQLTPPMTKNILQLFPQSIKIGMYGQYKVSAMFFWFITKVKNFLE